MSTSSSEADDPSPPAPGEADAVSPWVVRLFLILAFGLAFGIEGMTLVRSYLLDGEEETAQEMSQEEQVEDRAPLRLGDDLLPGTDVSERVAQMNMRARSSGPWAFRLVVAVANETEQPYRLTLRGLETEDGMGLDAVHTTTCAPGDSTRLVATWRMGADVRPRTLTAEADLGPADSTRTVQRRVSFGHVPVQMER